MKNKKTHNAPDCNRKGYRAALAWWWSDFKARAEKATYVREHKGKKGKKAKKADTNNA